MIKALVSVKNNKYTGFKCMGHANYADKGKDVVCASVSALVISTANSIEKLTDTDFKAKVGKDVIEYDFRTEPDEKACLLMDSLVLALKEIQKEYGSKYLNLKIG